MSDTEEHLKINLSGSSLSNLKHTERNLGVSTAQAVSDSFSVMNILSGQAKEGFTEVVVRNPVTQRERLLKIYFKNNKSS